MKPSFADLLSGIGGIRLGFERAGAECIFSCEKDSEARRVYEDNFDTTVDSNDITELEPENIPDHNILTAGWPCPSFSIMGDRDGLNDDRGSLIFEVVDILSEKHPDAFLLENVKHVTEMKDGEVFDRIVELLAGEGYSVHWEVLNALDFGLPQKRERVIIVGFNTPPDNFVFPKANNPLKTEDEQRRALEDLLVENPDEKYIASQQIRESRQEEFGEESPPEPSVWHENRSQNVSANPFSIALRANASWNYILINGERHPTPRELLRLQGFPDWFTVYGNSSTRSRKLTGKTVPVPVIQAVAEEIVAEIS